MTYRYLNFGGENNVEKTWQMEDSKRTQIIGRKSFMFYDLSNTDMRTSNSSDPNNNLKFERLKQDIYCWRALNDKIRWHFIEFGFDKQISDDYEAYWVVGLEVKNYTEAAPTAENMKTFAIIAEETRKLGSMGLKYKVTVLKRRFKEDKDYSVKTE